MAFIILITSQFIVLIIIVVHWTQLLEYWSQGTHYMLWIILVLFTCSKLSRIRNVTPQKWVLCFYLWPFYVLTESHLFIVNLSSFQDHLRISRVVLSSPVPSPIFTKFFLNFSEQQDQTKVVSSRSRQFGKCPLVSSCLEKKAGCAEL